MSPSFLQRKAKEMKRRNAFAIAGGLIGFFLGSSVGIAAGGTAINGAWVLSIVTAFIGWLIGNNQSASSNAQGTSASSTTDTSSEMAESNAKEDSVTAVLRGALELVASIWNFHIDLLQHIGLLNAFCERPWLFAAFALAVSVFFPPFAVLYFVTYLSAAMMGANRINQFRAQI